MNIKDQVIGLEQAQRLKELGIKQESVFYYHPSFSEFVLGGKWVTKTGAQYKIILIKQDKATLSMFTGSELGVMLPDDTRSYRYDNRWSVVLPIEGKMTVLTFEDDKNESQIRGALLIHLIENDLITVEQINERINHE
jgi:hypothetical protein